MNLLWVVLTLFFFFPNLSWAHRINIFATCTGKEVKGEVFFSDGRPARNATIKIQADGLTYETKTDKKGRFIYHLPRPATSIKISAYAGMGHKAVLTLTKASSTPKPLPSSPPKLGPSWREIFSGLGYIVGIFGIIAYLKARAYVSKNRSQG